jgi:hypothetical protein
MLKKLAAVLAASTLAVSVLCVTTTPAEAAVPAAVTGSVVKEITFYKTAGSPGVKRNVTIRFSSADTARSVSDAKCHSVGYTRAKSEIVKVINDHHFGLNSPHRDPSVGNGYEMDREMWWHTDKGLNDHSAFCD